MLKLISIFDVDFQGLKEYKASYISNFKEATRVVCMAGILHKEDYFAWLKRNQVDNYYFLIDDDNSSYIIGDCYLDANKEAINSNMGVIQYSIRPNERNKHYATYMLNLLLKLCQEKGIKEISISCLEDNLASKKVIENNSGKLVDRFFDVKNYANRLKYTIDTTESIKTKVLLND